MQICFETFSFKFLLELLIVIHPWEVPSKFYSFGFFLLQKFFLIDALVCTTLLGFEFFSIPDLQEVVDMNHQEITEKKKQKPFSLVKEEFERFNIIS